jgi:hypothetical protein
MNAKQMAIHRLFSCDVGYVHSTCLVKNKTQYLGFTLTAGRYLDVPRGELWAHRLSEYVLSKAPAAWHR